MMPSGELCDFIPLLYELLAVRSDNVHVRALELRLAAATERIRKHLSEDSPNGATTNHSSSRNSSSVCVQKEFMYNAVFPQ